MKKKLIIPGMIYLNSNNDICAAASGTTVKNLRDCSGVAYSGGQFQQYWSQYPVVVDLAGMEITAQTPLLYNHYNEPWYRLGAVAPVIANNILAVSGGVSSGQLADFVVEQGKTIDWQLSMGAQTLKAEEVPAGEKRTVNGRDFTGPFILVQKCKLREVSVVAVGADDETGLKIAASFQFCMFKTLNLNQGENGMKKEFLKWLIAKFSMKAESTEADVTAHVTAQKLDLAALEQECETSLKASNGGATPPIQAAATGAPAPAPAVSAGLTTEQVQAIADQAVVNARKGESERIVAINEACKDYPEVGSRAITAGWSINQTKIAIEGVTAVRAGRPEGGVNVLVRTSNDVNAQVLEAALCLRSGLPEAMILKAYGEQVITAADPCRDLSLKELMVQCAMIEHKPIGASFSNDTIKAAFSTMSLPGILSNTANKVLRQAYEAQPIIATRLCQEGDLNDFKESERYRMTDVGDLQPVAADGELKAGGLSEEKATNQLQTYGKIVTLTRTMIMNDDLGAFMNIPRGMGNKAARKIDQLFFARLISNPNSLFSTNHKNYLSGANSALGVESLKSAMKLFMEQVDADDEPINVMPRFLLTAPDLTYTARELTKGVVLAFAGGDATTGAKPTVAPTLNSLVDDNLEPITAPYLKNDPTAWYLFGDPKQVDTFEIGYLRGRRMPTVEQGAVDFNYLGMGFRVFFDLGVREQDHRGMVKSKGKQ